MYSSPYGFQREIDAVDDHFLDNYYKKWLTPAQTVPACNTGQGGNLDLDEVDFGMDFMPLEDSSITSLSSQLANTGITPPDSSTSTPAAAGETISCDLTGGNPSRKTSDSEDKTEEQSACEVERRADVEHLIKMLEKYRKKPLREDHLEIYRKLPREAIDELREELFFRDVTRKQQRVKSRYWRGPDGYRTAPSTGESDSDNDEFSSILQKDIKPPPLGKFVISQKQKLLRLLILGGTACRASGVLKRTRSNDIMKNSEYNLIPTMIEQGQGVQVVKMLEDISEKGRTPKKDGLLYGLAMCCRSQNMKTKAAAYVAFQNICGTPAQVFQVIKYIENYDETTTGWGRGLKRAVNRWYSSYENNPMRLAMHVTKYWNRHDWNHQDVMRLSHIKPVNDIIGFIIRYCVKGLDEAEKFYLEDGYRGREELEKVHKYLQVVEETKRTKDVARAVELIEKHRLVREQLKTELLNSAPVWIVMLKDMPLMALIRNLNKMTSLGIFDNPEHLQLVISKLSNVEAMKKARIHPIKLLLAYHIYLKGEGMLGTLRWKPKVEIYGALEKALYKSFKTVEPTNKRILIAVDISRSMLTQLADLPINAREIAIVMAMVTARVEPNCEITGFHDRLLLLNELFKDSNKTIHKLSSCIDRLGFGSTDCSLPMLWALKRRKEYDAFIVYTDNDTNCHRIPPSEALEKYRQEMNIPNAKLVVCAIRSNNFSIANPNDVNMLDVVGFDPDTPEFISEFLLGHLEI